MLKGPKICVWNSSISSHQIEDCGLARVNHTRSNHSTKSPKQILFHHPTGPSRKTNNTRHKGKQSDRNDRDYVPKFTQTLDITSLSTLNVKVTVIYANLLNYLRCVQVDAIWVQTDTLYQRSVSSPGVLRQFYNDDNESWAWVRVAVRGGCLLAWRDGTLPRRPAASLPLRHLHLRPAPALPNAFQLSRLRDDAAVATFQVNILRK